MLITGASTEAPSRIGAGDAGPFTRPKGCTIEAKPLAQIRPKAIASRCFGFTLFCFMLFCFTTWNTSPRGRLFQHWKQNTGGETAGVTGE